MGEQKRHRYGCTDSKVYRWLDRVKHTLSNTRAYGQMIKTLKEEIKETVTEKTCTHTHTNSHLNGPWPSVISQYVCVTLVSLVLLLQMSAVVGVICGCMEYLIAPVIVFENI